ncbi:MAG: response regulator [Verrucomicrobia bacterium]|nr:response regulator [Verrucomicrobiota bacterium]MBI3868485.1 response regulator [Verrucomicrobiota bacterium]
MTRRILIVDDQPQICELYGMFFEREGMRTSRAATAEECLTRVDGDKPDVVLLDINLAEEDGLDVLTRIKQAHPRTRVVMMTGMGYVDDLLREALNRGADGYVSKGLPCEELLQAVKRVMP